MSVLAAPAAPRPSQAKARLSDYAGGRDNNFNLIRLFAALGVIFTHSVAALGLPPAREIFYDRLGLSLGAMAVDVFFVTSGFLVTGSLMTRRSLIAFLWARALRIYPALWVMLALTVFGLAPLLTTLAAGDYFRSDDVYEYAWKCATLLGGVRYALPGVYESLPLKGEFNASLWTLPIEMRMYLYLAGAWLALALLPSIRLRAMRLAAPLVTAVLLAIVVRGWTSISLVTGSELRVFMFLAGATLYLWRDKIPLNRALLAALIAAFALAAFDKRAFFLVYVFGLPLLILHLAYLPRRRVRAFNAWGDVSYGTYIYAFPIQQTLVLLIPGMSLIAMVSASGTLTLAVAALSWTFIERRALVHKDDCAAATQRALDRVVTWMNEAIAGSPKF